MSAASVRPLRAPARYPVDAIGGHDEGPPANPWPMLEQAALYGLPGRVVDTISPHTEADPAALLVSFLVAFGSAANAGPHALADGAQHPGRLFAVVVGESSKARKGTSWARIREIMRAADSGWSGGLVSGLASGEGLVKEASSRQDRRLFVHEGEFARLLKVAGREGSTLSAVLRSAWDDGDLRVMTKEQVTAKDMHVSVLGHITFEELQATLTSVDATNGFANRFLFVCARRSKRLPHGGNLDEEEVQALGAKISERLDQARKLPRLCWSREAQPLWEALYDEMADDDPRGMLGSLIARAEAQLLRISVIYAMTEGSRWIELEHLEAAYAFWRYCRQSTAHIFGNRLGNPDAEKLLAALAKGGGVLSREDIRRAFAGHLPQRRLDQALEFLEARNLISRTAAATAGRPRQLIVLAS